MNEEFDIIDIIMNSIEKELNIPCFFLFCEEDLVDPYVIFQVTSEQETDVFDNSPIGEYYKLEITLWYTKPSDSILYRKIKNKLKEKGFKYKKSWDIIDENSNKTSETVRYYGKLMNFEYKRYIKEQFDNYSFLI